MAYNTGELFKKAKEAGEAKKFVFFEDYCASLGISSSTFYEHFPRVSSEYKELEGILQNNKTLLKNSIRKKWHDCDNPTAWKYLYLLIGSTKERHALHGSKTENKTKISGGVEIVWNEEKTYKNEEVKEN